ncbi:MAG: DMT family transporter [Chloroflexi bacterium]|nr:DMT family transporter [Chloroflexota bacterium]MQC17391.1 EamA family transporter [Chloroflexota bacterium]
MHSPSDERTDARRKLAGIAFAFSAAISYGTSQVLTRSATDETSPLVGALIALFFGTLGFALLSARTLIWNRNTNGDLQRGVPLVIGAGIFSACGVLLMFLALQRGEVVAVSPVLATNPLFTLAFAIVMLRGVERVTLRIVAGALLVVVGVIILSIT